MSCVFERKNGSVTVWTDAGRPGPASINAVFHTPFIINSK